MKLLAAVLLVALTAKVDHPAPPTILHAPHVLTASEPIVVEVQSEPHADRRTVLLELWEVEPSDEGDPDMPGDHFQYGPLVRGSVEPADEKNRDQRTFRFEWESQEAGTYALIARVGCTKGRTYSAAAQIVEIR